MKNVYLIGIGAGNPEYITVQAIKALNRVDVFFFMDKGETKQDLTMLRKEICDTYIKNPNFRIVEAPDPVRDLKVSDYKERVELWHNERTLIYEDMIGRELEEGQCGAFLVWGDPSLYDSTLKIIDQVTARGKVSFHLDIIPGISSMHALAARHKITLNELGESVLITTGRRLSDKPIEPGQRTVVMLDGQCSFKERMDEDLEIFWAAYLGMDKEILLSGKLADVGEEIERVRAESRQKNGWIMDMYVLCKPKLIHANFSFATVSISTPFCL